MPFKRSFFSIPLLVMAGRFAGVLIPLFVAHFYGVSADTDAFFFVLGVVLLVVETASHLLESVLVPDLTAHKKDPSKMFCFGNAVLLTSLAAGMIFFALFWISAPLLLKHWSAPGSAFSRQILQMLIEMSPFLFLATCSCLANGLFYVYKIFWFPALSPLIRSGTVVLAMIAGHEQWGIHAVTAGFAAGELLRTLLSFWLLAKLASWKPVLDLKSTRIEVKNFLAHAGFQVMAILAFNLFLVTDQWFASRLGAGQLSLLSYSDRLFLIPYQLFGAGILHILHADWSDLYHREPAEVFQKKIWEDLVKVLGFAFLFSCAAWLFSRFAVELAYGHGQMKEEDLGVIGGLFAWQMIGFIPAVMNLSYSRLFFILKKSRFYFAYSWIRFILKVVLNAVFMGFYGLSGIVVSTVMVNLTAAGGLHFYLKRHLKKAH